MKASRTTSIRTHEDFVRFQNETNGLHDAYLLFDHPYVTFFDLSDPETRTEVRAREMAWRWIDEKEESTMTEHENTHNHLNENVPTDYL